MDFKYTLSQTLRLSFLVAMTPKNDTAMDLSVIISWESSGGVFFSNADCKSRLLDHSVCEIIFTPPHESQLKMG